MTYCWFSVVIKPELGMGTNKGIKLIVNGKEWAGSTRFILIKQPVCFRCCVATFDTARCRLHSWPSTLHGCLARWFGRDPESRFDQNQPDLKVGGWLWWPSYLPGLCLSNWVFFVLFLCLPRSNNRLELLFRGLWSMPLRWKFSVLAAWQGDSPLPYDGIKLLR